MQSDPTAVAEQPTTTEASPEENLVEEVLVEEVLVEEVSIDGMCGVY
jgi:mycofactocin precursor